MKIDQVANLEQKLNRTLKTAVLLHCIGLVIFALILAFEPVSYKKMGLSLSTGMFLASIFLSRPYFYVQNELKNHKTNFPKSAIRQFNQKFLIFFFPYTFWCSCIGVFL